MSLFAGKTLMITGGTGSFGNAVLNRFLRTDIAEIRIFSRDEKKQDDMRHDYQVRYPDVANKIQFYIGDVRSLESIRSAMPGTDYVYSMPIYLDSFFLKFNWEMPVSQKHFC